MSSRPAIGALRARSSRVSGRGFDLAAIREGETLAALEDRAVIDGIAIPECVGNGSRILRRHSGSGLVLCYVRRAYDGSNKFRGRRGSGCRWHSSGGGRLKTASGSSRQGAGEARWLARLPCWGVLGGAFFWGGVDPAFGGELRHREDLLKCSTRFQNGCPAPGADHLGG